MEKLKTVDRLITVLAMASAVMLCVFVLIAITATLCLADSNSDVSTPPVSAADQGIITMRGQVVMRLSEPSSGDVADRTAVVQSRLDQAMARTNETVGPDVQVVVQPVLDGGNVAPAMLTVNGAPIITIDPGLANARGYGSPTELAQAWMKTILSADFGTPVALNIPAQHATATAVAERPYTKPRYFHKRR